MFTLSQFPNFIKGWPKWLRPNDLLNCYIKLRDITNIEIFFEKAKKIDQNYIEFIKNSASLINRNDRSFFWRLTVKENIDFFNSLLGSEVRSSLFEFVDFGTASVIQRQIEITLDNFEPRIENVQVEVNPSPDTNEFEVTVIFDIVGQEFPTQEFTFILEATR